MCCLFAAAVSKFRIPSVNNPIRDDVMILIVM